jgi:hypothetical protein
LREVLPITRPSPVNNERRPVANPEAHREGDVAVFPELARLASLNGQVMLRRDPVQERFDGEL